MLNFKTVYISKHFGRDISSVNYISNGDFQKENWETLSMNCETGGEEFGYVGNLTEDNKRIIKREGSQNTFTLVYVIHK